MEEKQVGFFTIKIVCMIKNKIYIVSFLVSVLCFSCDEPTEENSTVNNTNITIVSDSVAESDANINVQEDEITKQDDMDKIVDVAQVGVDMIKDGIAFKNKKDSIRKANKEKLWVYQIGNAINAEDVATMAYEKIKDISNIYIFKLKKREYYLIKDDGYYSYEQLMDSIGDVKRRVSMVTSDRLLPIDLSAQCSSKKKPTITNSIKYKVNKERKEIECRVCD